MGQICCDYDKICSLMHKVGTDQLTGLKRVSVILNNSIIWPDMLELHHFAFCKLKIFGKKARHIARNFSLQEGGVAIEQLLSL